VIISPFIPFLFLLIYKNRYSQIITIGPGPILPTPPWRGKRGREERREKMMSCKCPDRGCFVYYCPKCEEYREISLGCNSRLCSDCVSGKMFNVPHRHAVYMRHPAIVNSRICGYDGEEVTFWYIDRDYVKYYKTMSVDEFIAAIIQHVPERRLQFKMIRIRYYGGYCRKWKSRYSRYLSHSSISQSQRVIGEFCNNYAPRCPKCVSRMEFVCEAC